MRVAFLGEVAAAVWPALAIVQLKIVGLEEKPECVVVVHDGLLDAALELTLPIVAAVDHSMGLAMPIKRGVRDVVSTPIEPDDLARKVRRAIKRHRRDMEPSA